MAMDRGEVTVPQTLIMTMTSIVPITVMKVISMKRTMTAQINKKGFCVPKYVLKNS